MAKPIGLGDTARDSITGFEGVVVCVSQWLYGCRRISIQPRQLDPNGKPVDYASFDEPQCELIGLPETSVLSREAGGPRPEPTRH